MATKKKAAPKKTAAEKAAPRRVAVDPAAPSKTKLTLVSKKQPVGATPKDLNDQVHRIAIRIMQDSDRDYITRGQLNLYLTAVTGIAADTNEARNIVSDAEDAGVLVAV